MLVPVVRGKVTCFCAQAQLPQSVRERKLITMVQWSAAKFRRSETDILIFPLHISSFPHSRRELRVALSFSRNRRREK